MHGSTKHAWGCSRWSVHKNWIRIAAAQKGGVSMGTGSRAVAHGDEAHLVLLVDQFDVPERQREVPSVRARTRASARTQVPAAAAGLGMRAGVALGGGCSLAVTDGVTMYSDSAV